VFCIRDLQVEYVDLFLIHWPLKFRKGTGFPPREEDFLPLDIKAGLARAIGVSNFSTKKLESLLEYAVVKPAFDQVPYKQTHFLLACLCVACSCSC
jgi:diketogulonate reductase-like aldo/keto reductase